MSFFIYAVIIINTFVPPSRWQTHLGVISKHGLLRLWPIVHFEL